MVWMLGVVVYTFSFTMICQIERWNNDYDLILPYDGFVGLALLKAPSDHSFFGQFRQAVGTKQIGKLFKEIVNKSTDLRDNDARIPFC